MQPILKPEKPSQILSGCDLGGVGLEGAGALLGLGPADRQVLVYLAFLNSGDASKEIISRFGRLIISSTKKGSARVQLRTFLPCPQFLSIPLFLLSLGRRGIWMLCFGVVLWLWRFLRLRSLLGFVFGGNLGLTVRVLGSSGALMNTVVKQRIYTWLYINLVHSYTTLINKQLVLT